MLDVLKRLAELDAGNPNVMSDVPVLNKSIKETASDKEDHVDEEPNEGNAYGQAVQNTPKGQEIKINGKGTGDIKKEDMFDEEQVDECGMMPMGGMNDHHTPASINITADSGDELSAMLRDIMTLAGRDHHGHDMSEPMNMQGDVPPPAEISTDGGDSMDYEPGMMRSMIDKLNPGDDDQDDSELDKDDVREYDNEPAPETSGYASMTPTGNDLNSKGDNEAGAVNGGGNPYTKTMEQIERDLFAEYRKFVGE